MPKNEALRLLARLQSKTDHAGVKRKISEHLHDAARKKGVTKSQLEDSLIENHGLVDGQLQEMIGRFTANLQLYDNGKINVDWIKPNGKAQKTVPSELKKDASLKPELNQLFKLKKEITETYKYQKKQLEQRLRFNAIWKYDEFKSQFLNHGLLCVITKQLIWTFKKEGKSKAVLFDKKWQDVEGNSFLPDKHTTVTLWHPIYSTSDEVLVWRELLTARKIVQPFKQAFREVYLLTDAEINSGNKSARMSSHMLKQHVLNKLSKQRNWSYSLLGNYEGADTSTYAIFSLGDMRGRCEFYCLPDNDEYTNAGIWKYVVSGHLQFIGRNNIVIELVDVPPIVFSEVMRDLDLFMAVCSVGNDPEWLELAIANQDAHRYYWEKDAFGQLNERAKSRKVLLETLLPKLKTKKVTKVEGNYVHVQGKLKSYKIHISSGNILIQPNDRYLCIVSKSTKFNMLEKIYLPFEGDKLLSVIISKIFLLSEDHKITDATILNQIK